MSILETSATQGELRVESSKRLMLVSGRANPALAARIGDKLGVELSPLTLKTFANG
jgi:ribose-phosphate pyrophosphokinase